MLHKIKKKKKPSNKTWNLIKFEWCELDFTSKIVLLIGFTLFIELLIAIFLGGRQDWANMSFRTSLSAILGYLLGGMGKSKPRVKEVTVTFHNDDQLKTPIGDSSECSLNNRTINDANHIRSLIAGMVCFIGILTIFIFTVLNIDVYNEGVLQLRDMISTTLGFLVSTSIKKE